MFFEKSYQAQLIHDELNRSPKKRLHLAKNKTLRETIKEKAKNYLVLFLETSSIHGLNHLVAARRHPCEVLLWLAIVALSVFGSVFLSRTTWTRYQYSPTVISMDRDMFAWNTTFPSVTVCPNIKLDEQKLEAFVQSHPDPDKEKLEKFIRALSNSTYENFQDIPDYDGIPADSFMDLLLNLTRSFKPTLTIGATGIDMEIMPTITELGLCYAVNSKVAAYNSPLYRSENRWDLFKEYNQTLFVHPLDGEVFAQVINLSTSYNSNFRVKAAAIVDNFTVTELSVNQRRCRFSHENNLKHNAIYTYNMCRMECRIRLCIKRCGCIPHFYRRIGEETVCNVEGLHCLAKFSEELYNLQDLKTKKKLNCECYPLCDDVNYVIQSNVLQEWFLGTNFQWGIVTYPRMRYRRDIIFGFTDVLVSVGGMAGLFLGCSVLSFMEIVYFLSLRLVCYTRANVNK